MNEQKTEKKRSPLLWIVIALLVIVIALLILLLLRGGRIGGGSPGSAAAPELESGAEQYTGQRDTYTGPKNTDTIDIPGFDAMNLKAGETTQAVNLFNPPQNSCYFRISLLLADRTPLWESKLVEPGMGLYEIELNEPLEAGVYEGAILKYECFAMDDALSPLNGSEITLTLNVYE